MPDRERVIGHMNDCLEAPRADNGWVFVRAQTMRWTFSKRTGGRRRSRSAPNAMLPMSYSARTASTEAKERIHDLMGKKSLSVK